MLISRIRTVLLCTPWKGIGAHKMARGDKGYKKMKSRVKKANRSEEEQFDELQDLANTPHKPFKMKKAGISRADRKKYKRWGKS